MCLSEWMAYGCGNLLDARAAIKGNHFTFSSQHSSAFSHRSEEFPTWYIKDVHHKHGGEFLQQLEHQYIYVFLQREGGRAGNTLHAFAWVREAGTEGVPSSRGVNPPHSRLKGQVQQTGTPDEQSRRGQRQVEGYPTCSAPPGPSLGTHPQLTLQLSAPKKLLIY